MSVWGRIPPLDVAKHERFIGCVRASYCQILLMKTPTHVKQKSRGWMALTAFLHWGC